MYQYIHIILVPIFRYNKVIRWTGEMAGNHSTKKPIDQLAYGPLPMPPMTPFSPSTYNTISPNTYL